MESFTQGRTRTSQQKVVKVDSTGNARAHRGCRIMPSTEMWGTISDTEQASAKRSFREEARIPIPRFYILTPMPGSELFEEFMAQGGCCHENYRLYDGHPAACIAGAHRTGEFNRNVLVAQRASFPCHPFCSRGYCARALCGIGPKTLLALP
jgi:hypothetical protein